ncbi:MAG: CYTH and CHAD domain-containing protein [Betaproteobacteria bacterium]|nr:CYTH and CHAD domain-containing protein [Betaproteobacteria bacterium]
MEIELKLRIEPDAAAALRRHPLLVRHAIGPPRVQRLAATYFDTADLILRRHGAALRVRRVARRWIQTLKAGGDVAAGLHSRQEWETRTSGPAPDLAALRELDGIDPEWAGILAVPDLSQGLVPIFTTRFRRTSWQLRLDDGTELELALDQGTAEHETARAPISEVELELKSGDPARLFGLALELQAALPLRVSNVSKAERGFALRAPGPPAVVKAVPLRFPAQPRVEQGLRAIVGNCLAQIQGNEDGVTLGGDIESVHQMRVGVRRLRVALRLFERVAPCPAALQTEIKWLAAELGAARDWEVLAGITLAEVGDACPAATGIEPLRAAALALATAKRKRAAEAVDSARYARLLLTLGHWLLGAVAHEALPPAQQAALAAPLGRFAARVLKNWHGRLLRQGAGLSGATPEARHQVRIVAKRVRYATDFFASLYPPRRLRRYVKALTAMQDILGRMNDAAVAAGLLRQLVQADPALAESAGFVNGFLSADARRAASKLDRRWRQIERIGPPRRK